jgi:hypothetical protein
LKFIKNKEETLINALTSMKKYKLLLFLVLSIPAMAQEKNELILKTDVSEATVFINGAQIIRRKSIELLPGKSTIKFAGLSPYIDSKSVQVKVNNGIMVLSVNHQLNYTDSLKQSNEISKLESQLETLNDKIKIENANLEIIKEEVAFLNDNKNIGGTNQGVNLLNLKNAADYYHEKISAFKFKEIEIKKLLDKLEKEKNAIEKQELILGRTKTLPVGEVLLKVDSKVATKCNIELSYYVNNAGWYPSYDIRANTIEDPVELVYKATIHQNTKEDWKNVKLKVSSVNPNIGNIAPQLQTYFLNYYSKPPKYDGNNSTNQVTGKVMDNNTKEPIAGASILIKGTTIGTVSNLDGNFELSIPANGGQLEISYIGYEKQLLPISNSQMNIFMKENLMKLEEVVVVGYGTKNNIEEALQGRVAGIDVKGKSSPNSKKEYTPLPTNQIENQTNVEFEIKTPYSISSDNKSITVEVDRYNLPAEYKYYCAPKVDKDAFLLANIVNWEKFNLLEGEANIFFENTFVGKTILDVRYTSDTLQLSLGRDKNVLVNREKIKDTNKKQFLGNKKEDTRSWRITVKNNKKQIVNFVLSDQIPVSTMEEIEVIPENLSGGILNKENGEIKWRFTLKPATKNELELKYKVKYPKDRTLSIE